MVIPEILKQNHHRPWPLPSQDWKYYQEWNDAIFLHWQVDADLLKYFIPAEIEIDLFEGEPWISLVAFTMENIRPRNIPSFSLISDFHEVNIRTYVKYNGKSGVYFLSIEGGKLASCKIAKAISGLPYRFSQIRRRNGFYSSSNKEFKDEMSIRFKLGETQSQKTDLEYWLIERYALFQKENENINTFDIHHIPWSIQKINLEEVKIDYPRFEKLFIGKPDLYHYSNGVQVVAWDKQKLS